MMFQFTFIHLGFSLSLLHLLFLNFTFSMQSLPLCHVNEHSALLQFKQSLAFDNCLFGGYPKVASWKAEDENDDCCSWEGVTCNEFTGHVVKLDLSSSCLSGSINSSSSIFQLVHLESLNLASNDFTLSKIPSEIMNLSRLSLLDLSRSSFSGQIPLEILNLSKLKSFDVSYNSLELKKPSLRSLIEKLTNLEILDLSDVNIPSSVPHSLTNLSSLTHLSLYGCDLQGEFPAKIFQLPNLRLLSLEYNWDLKGYLPEFEKNSSLEELMLFGNNFSGEIPDSIGNLKSLVQLRIGGGNFSGTIPHSLVNLVSLEYMSFPSNNFSSQNSRSLSWISKLRKLSSLDLSEIDLVGEIPSWVMNLTQLTVLCMDGNQLTGPIPYWLVRMKQLTILRLANNQLTGRIPSEIRNLTQLSLESNQSEGPIPSSIFELENLQELDLGFNKLIGTLDLDMLFHKLKSLDTLILSSNNLTLLTKTSVSTVFQNFQIIGLRSCNLRMFPNFLRNQDQLLLLDLSSNNIAGQIPSWLLNISINCLELLNLSHNLLTGFDHHPVTLPWTGNLYDDPLVTLDLSYNKLQGTLPIPSAYTFSYLVSNNQMAGGISHSICSLNILHVLDLSHNNLTGMLPECLSNFSDNLSVLKLQGNRFHGRIPHTFMIGANMRMLDLSNNLLQGRIPRSLMNCIKLEFLHLGSNQITDIFPYWLGPLPELKVLILNFNRFHGIIEEPMIGCEFPKLHVIDMSHNRFTGNLPSKFFQCWNAMKVVNASKLSYMQHNLLPPASIPGIDYGYSDYSITLSNKGISIEYRKLSYYVTAIILSSNEFAGEIPTSIGSLKGLHILDLSNNHFQGHIPSCLGNLTVLESLDLSNNKLSGMIPQQLVELTSLEFFNVSHNHLTGPIPQGKQFNTFENDSYDGNPRLCGKPLSKRCEISEAPPPQEVEYQASSSPFVFGWEIVVIGYASGLIIGLVLGHIATARKPEWFAKTFGVQLKS